MNFIRLRMGFDCGRQKILSTRPSRTDTSWCACPGRCPSSPLVHRHLNEPLEQICSFQTCAAIPFRGATLQRGGDSAPLPSCGEGLVLPQGWVGPAGRIRPESSQSRECNWTAGSTHRSHAQVVSQFECNRRFGRSESELSHRSAKCRPWRCLA